MLTFDSGILDLFSAVGAVFHGEWSSYCRMLGCYIHLSYIKQHEELRADQPAT